MITETQRFSLWGQTFEIAVKRGVLLALSSWLKDAIEPGFVNGWEDYDVGNVYAALDRELAEVDPNIKEQIRETGRHIFQLGMGLGQTAMREYLDRLPGDSEDYEIRALWAPLQLPMVVSDFESEGDTDLHRFTEVMNLNNGVDRALLWKGYPARADFLLWLEPRYAKMSRELLCIEFSFNGSPEIEDYRDPEVHLNELRRYSWFVDSRSVFANVCAEVNGEEFRISPALAKHLPAFTGRDKPLYKLCQACSYLVKTTELLNSHGFGDRPLNARALSITQNGLESLGGKFFTKKTDPRVALIEALGKAYRETENIPDDSPEDLLNYIRFAFKQIRKSLPLELSRQFGEMGELPNPGQDVTFDFTESVSDFANPMSDLSWDRALSQVDHTPETENFFGRTPIEAVRETLLEKIPEGDPVPLRDLHAATIRAGMRSAKPGELLVLGLEGNPGIGKTTAVVSDLVQSAGKDDDSAGFLFLYVSPRVVINDDVTGNLARDRETKEPTGILTITTNSKLIGAARTWHEKQTDNDNASKRYIDSAVVVDGVADLRAPESSTLVLSPEQKEELELQHLPSRIRKTFETERQDRMEDEALPGVLKVLSQTTRHLLSENIDVNRVVLTAAIQGYRQVGNSASTIDALSKLFRHSAQEKAGVTERQAFGERIPTIVVMVDELTGDQAGALFIQRIARWLDEQFIEPFENSTPIFRVVLIISDASLGNDVVLDRYLQSAGGRKRKQSQGFEANGTPDKVLISPSMGKREFQIAGSRIKLAGRLRPTLHVMANSYPAKTLQIDYRVRMNMLHPGELPDGRPQTIRQAIGMHRDEVLMGNVAGEIIRAVGSNSDQVIFFAQDKAFLRDLQSHLIALTNEKDGLSFRPGQVVILDSSVTATKRKELISDQRRDKIKVFLMTSSGARGISFPKTDCIIALLPRFNIEAALMEIAQLIYRGRGGRYEDDDGNIQTDGDWKDRRLIFLMQDFMAFDDELDERRWMRQVSDLLTFIVLLRATVLTRIIGDSGLEGRSLAVVPVGGIGADEMKSLMSDHVRDFLTEATVFIRDTGSDKNRVGVVVDAQANTEALFSNYELGAVASSSEVQSIVRLEDVQAFTRRASAENAPLLLSAKKEPKAVLPRNLYCVAPFWLEHWGQFTREERFSIEGWLTGVTNQAGSLLRQLRAISEDKTLPGKLRTPAKDLYKILARTKEESSREFSTVKSIASRSTWIAVPVDYARFWKADDEGRYPSLDDHESWRDAIGRCISDYRSVMPVIPYYEDIPYAASERTKDPLRLDLVFDNRYFAASTELNLLNAILLAPE